MAAQKRNLEDSTSPQKAKRSRTESNLKGKSKSKASNHVSAPSVLQPEEVDFPRGGGTSFTPLEVKAIRAEAVKEANAELFKEDSAKKAKKKTKKRPDASGNSSSHAAEGKDRIRIEHLNYKRINVGMKIFGQIVHILPLALVVSLPNQLYGHVPITNISDQFTQLLERLDAQDLPSEPEEDDDDEADDVKIRPAVPELAEVFHVGQYVRTVVSAVHAPGTTDVSGVSKARDDVSRASKRVELSLVPGRVNSGIQKSDLKAGFTICGAIKSKEDHGYVVDFGIKDINGFLSFKDSSRGGSSDPEQLHIGSIVDVTVTKVSANGRICNVTTDPSLFASSVLTEISSVTSVLPGALVHSLITNVHTTGLNLQVLGFFDGTIDEFHLDKEASSYKVGKKVKARVLYDYSSSPPKFALSLATHVAKLGPKSKKNEEGALVPVREVYPIGTVLDEVKVLRVESERGVIVEIEPGVEGLVHISHTSDEHVPSLTSNGPWKPGSLHRARVTGYFAFDGLLQLSMKSSIIDQKYLQVSDVQVGEVVKGTIKKLTDQCLVVSLAGAGGVDGVVWPNHYADIVLKHPAKRFKDGASIKCRVLGVDQERRRIVLTAKKTLLDSTLPILADPEDVKQGIVAHAVIFRTHEKHLMVEFYNNMKAFVPVKEVGELPKARMYEAFPIGKVVKVRILNTDDGRITASIRQAAPSFDIVTDISSIEIGQTVEGKISEIHNDNVLLTLEPSNIRSLLSLKNLANHRSQTVAQLKANLQVGESLDELVVVTRNPEKSLVIVANKPKPKPTLAKGHNISLDTVTIGQLVGGRITRHARNGALVKVTSHIGGILHFTDVADDFEAGGSQLPGVDSIIRATVVGIDKDKRQLSLSTRRSRSEPEAGHTILHREINSLDELEVGQSVRGFVKNIMGHGLFVTIGRDIDARVQIRELFDEFVKEWQGRFQVHQVVSGRILSIDKDTKKVEMSLRSKDAIRKQSSAITLSDLRSDQKVEGVIKRVEEYGLFIQIAGSKMSGLCHKSELSDNAEADVSVALKGFREGDKVKAMVLSVENRRIALSLKPSHFTEEDFAGSDGDSEGEDEEMKDVRPETNDDEDSDADSHMEEDQGEGSESDEEMEVDVGGAQILYRPPPVVSKKASATNGPTLSAIGGFQWSHSPQDEAEDEDNSSSDEEDQATAPKKRRKRKEIEQDLTAGMHTKTPESNADFERLLLGSPNSSYLWIQYMSFQLPLSEVDKARDIARRAIKTINFREEQERMNVWIALLNLENVYGTDETLDAVFKEAARANDSKTIYLRLATIFEQSEKHQKAEEQYRKTCKKFGQSSKVWTFFGQFLLKRGDLEEARKLLPRSLQSLEKRKHLKTISQFAQLEYKHGDPERGKTLFEGIVDSHPKRWDMWSVYMDMEATQRNIQGLRNLFDRVLTFKMTSHKAKAFFKKWLELEKRIGDEEGGENVKAKAVEWTQRAASNGS